MTTILISKQIKNTVVGTFPLLFRQRPPPPSTLPKILDQPQNTAVQMNWRCCQDFDATDKNHQLSKNMVISWTRSKHYSKNMRPKDFMGRNSFSRLQCCAVIKIGRDKFRGHRQWSVETVNGGEVQTLLSHRLLTVLYGLSQKQYAKLIKWNLNFKVLINNIFNNIFLFLILHNLI